MIKVSQTENSTKIQVEIIVHTKPSPEGEETYTEDVNLVQDLLGKKIPLRYGVSIKVYLPDQIIDRRSTET